MDVGTGPARIFAVPARPETGHKTGFVRISACALLTPGVLE